MNTIGFSSLLNTKTTNVWADFVPEGKLLPAVTYTHITNGFDRILNGKKTGLWDTWRVRIIGENRTDSESILTTLETLDNTNSADFKNVFVIFSGNSPALPEDKTRTAVIDIKTYDR